MNKINGSLNHREIQKITASCVDPAPKDFEKIIAANIRIKPDVEKDRKLMNERMPAIIEGWKTGIAPDFSQLSAKLAEHMKIDQSRDRYNDLYSQIGQQLSKLV